MKSLGHGSLQMNVIYGIPQVQSWDDDSKLEILVQKIKVEKLDFNSYYHEFKSDNTPVYTII